jgi:3-hydroxyacyl-[acyl-carrier-protein] dehydratase
MNSEEIIKLLPYQAPFLFVDKLTTLSADGIVGNYTFKKNEFFYLGHFKNTPITPGVILIEVMAQIGVVCFGIYLLKDRLKKKDNPQIALTSSKVDFFIPIVPGELVKVESQKEYFRFNKLKCNVKLYNTEGKLACRGVISGMINDLHDE